MKKLIISLLILVAIIISGIYSIYSIKRSSTKIQDSIEKTSGLAEAGDWSGANSQIKLVEKEWNKTEKSWAILVDHFEIDSIESSIIRSKKYIETRDMPLSLAELENLKFSVEHIYKKEIINIKNIF